MSQKSRIIHRVIERLDNRIALLVSLRDKLQLIADRYDEQDHDPQKTVPKV